MYGPQQHIRGMQPVALSAQQIQVPRPMNGPYALASNVPDDIAKWDQFMDTHAYQYLWKMQDETEEERYGGIVRRLTAIDREVKADEDYIQSEKAHWTERKRQVGKYLKAKEDRLDIVLKAADQVELAWRDQRLRDNKHAERIKAYESATRGCQYLVRNVQMNGQDDRGMLTVFCKLHTAKYYLGYNGGDYIFRHNQAVPPRRDTGRPSSVLFNHTESFTPAWLDDLYSEPLDPVPDNTRHNFVYSGQVPRPKIEYRDRLNIVLPDVLRLLISVIGFHLRGDAAAFFWEHRALPNVICNNAMPSVMLICRLWFQHIGHEGHPSAAISDRLFLSSRVLELAHLLSRMQAGGNDDIAVHQIRPLVGLLEKATRRSHHEMIDAADARTAEMAAQKLFSEANFTNVMVFDDQNVMNIHDFFRQPQFELDPKHLTNQYKRLNVEAALQASRELHNFHWEFELSTDLELEIDAPPKPAQRLNDATSNSGPISRKGLSGLSVEPAEHEESITNSLGPPTKKRKRKVPTQKPKVSTKQKQKVPPEQTATGVPVETSAQRTSSFQHSRHASLFDPSSSSTPTSLLPSSSSQEEDGQYTSPTSIDSDDNRQPNNNSSDLDLYGSSPQPSSALSSPPLSPPHSPPI